MKITRRELLKNSLYLTSISPFLPALNALSDESSKIDSESVSPSRLPRWRGFNLLEKFNGRNSPFLEDDFRNISDLGFNFVRLPMDYRIWQSKEDPNKFDEKTFSEIDQAIEFGEKYGVHVSINFHRAPGYTVAQPQEDPLIWNSQEALENCARHWRFFAKRYCSIPSSRLSFNLLNEPAQCSEQEYYNVAKRLCDAIRAESPDRLIICDGLEWGRTPCLSFKDLNVAMATRGYDPMRITHYGATWIQQDPSWGEPQWPFTTFNGLLPAPYKEGLSEELRKPLLIKGSFPNNSTLRLRISVVSNSAELVIKADGKEIYRRQFVPTDGEGEWKEVVYNKQYETYQNIYDLDVYAAIPQGAKEVAVALENGDWLNLSEIGISAPSYQEATIRGSSDWIAKEQTMIDVADVDGRIDFQGSAKYNRETLKEKYVDPWFEAQKAGIGVMVGEFGVFKHTPHNVALHWMEDCLINWSEAGWGWALWNFRGPNGIAYSERADVQYEEWRGLLIDRAMLSLLQRY